MHIPTFPALIKLSIVAFALPVLFLSCQTKAENSGITENQPSDEFKVIGYTSAFRTEPNAIPYELLTHINYSFAIPHQDADGRLLPIAKPDTLRALVQKAHEHNVEVFIAVGGWDIGDGGGNDQRFEELADDPKTRTAFVESLVNLVDEFDLDGVDMDWEYPDPILPSADNYVALMKELREKLQPKNKKLTAAVVSYHDKHGYGIKDEVFELVDWLNLMAYDDDHNTFEGKHVPHSPYWLAVRSFEYWIDSRGLPGAKAVMGVPFYGKGDGTGASYKELLEQGADPYADIHEEIYYNGITTIKEKTKLAKERGSGIMIWEIPLDSDDQYSLLKAINEEAGGL